MSRKFNFSAGPAGLPDEVVLELRESLPEYGDLGASIMEVSHRGAAFESVCDEARASLRRLLAIPDNYWILFVGGGASGQMSAVPMNLLADDERAAYIISGRWSALAAAEAARYRRIALLGDGWTQDSADANTSVGERWAVGGEAPYVDLPRIDAGAILSNTNYFHYTDNETVNGVEYSAPPVVAGAPLVTDMSSNLLTKEIRVGDYGLIYAGAQKNLGCAGVTVVIVRDDLPRAQSAAPAVWDYCRQAAAGSMLNTPPTWAIYVMRVYLRWLESRGGVAQAAAQAAQKSRCIYEVLDEGDFYSAPVVAGARSRINIPFFLPTDALTDAFLRESARRGFIGLKGHKAVGGIRASMYNALPLTAARELADFMRDFARRHRR